MAKASGGESGQHMTWTQAWNYAKSLPYELQKDMIFALNVEVYDFLAFATEAVQIEVLGAAPDYVIDLFRDKKRKYTKIVDGKARVGYLPIILPDVLEYLNEQRGIKTESRKSKRKGCHSKKNV